MFNYSFTQEEIAPFKDLDLESKIYIGNYLPAGNRHFSLQLVHKMKWKAEGIIISSTATKSLKTAPLFAGYPSLIFGFFPNEASYNGSTEFNWARGKTASIAAFEGLITWEQAEKINKLLLAATKISRKEMKAFNIRERFIKSDH